MAVDVSREPVEPDYSELESSVRNWLAASRAAGATDSGLGDDLDVPSPR